MKHKPILKNKDGVVFYTKTELDDNFIHKQTKTISINARAMEGADYIIVNLKHLGVILSTSKKRLMAEGFIKEYYGEKKYYLHLEKWAVVKGNQEWFKRFMG